MDAGLRADIEQTFCDRVRTHDAGDLVPGQVAIYRFPAASAVIAPEQIGFVVGELVAGGGDVDRIGKVGGDFDAADIGEFGHRFRRHVLPGLAAVARHMHQAVVGRGPDLVPPMGRFDDAGAGRVDLGAGAFAGDRPAGRPLPLARVQAQVGRDALPAHALVAAAEHAVAAGIDRPRIVRREDDREGPGEAVLQILRRDARGLLGPHVHELDLPRAMVIALKRAGAARARSDGADVDHIVVARIDGDEARLAGTGIGAVRQRDHTPFRRAGDGDRGIVLLRAVDAIGILVVDIDAIELRGLLVVDGRPRSP